MDTFLNLADDQAALLGCAAALVLCGGMTVLGNFIGRARRRKTEQRVSLKIPARPVTPGKRDRGKHPQKAA